MRALLLLVFALLLPVAATAAPSVTCTLDPSYRNGTTLTAPAYVHVDCTATTDSDPDIRPFHDLDWKIDYGDSACSSGQGTWANSWSGASKNFDSTPIGAHVYECAGTFTITSTACHRATSVCDSDTDQITVESEDSGWPTTETKCVACGSTPTAGAGGCPSGASVQDSCDYDVSLQTGAGRRTLYKCGESFGVSGNPTLTDASADGSLIGGYGSCPGNPAIVTMDYTGTLHGTGSSDLTLNNWRFRDIRYDATGTASTADHIFHSTGGGVDSEADKQDILLLRVDTLGVALCPSMGNPGTEPLYNHRIAFFSGRCTLTDANDTAGYHALFQFTSVNSAIVDYFWDGSSTESNWMRFMGNEKLLFAHSRHRDVGASQLTIQVRNANDGSGRGDRFNIFTDQRIHDDSAEGFRVFTLCREHDCGSGDTAEIKEDAIVEKLFITYGTSQGRTFVSNSIRVSGDRTTVRNNIIDYRGVTRFGPNGGNVSAAITVDTTGGTSNDIEVYNNTAILDGTTSDSVGACSFGAGTGHRCRNNLIYDLDDTDNTTVPAGGTFVESNNVHLNASEEGCPFKGTDGSCTLTGACATGDSISADCFEIRASGGSRASVYNAGFDFPDTSTAGREPGTYTDAMDRCRGAEGPDLEWDIGALEYGASTCSLGSIPQPQIEGGGCSGCSISDNHP